MQELVLSPAGTISYVHAAIIINPAVGKRWALNKPAVPFAAYTDMPPMATGINAASWLPTCRAGY